ncbi:MAG: PHP domain-containing protein [Clostridiales bacterium]
MIKNKINLSELEIENIENLNYREKEVRLNSLKLLLRNDDLISLYNEKKKYFLVNNHIHTKYSFSPYSPTKAIWMAYNTGLTTAGIMDHESVMGGLEFKQAGKITGIATTTGMEFRADFSDTKLNNRKINHPDQNSIAYIAIHGIPESKIVLVDEYFEKYRKIRNQRNREMVDNINTLLKDFSIKLDFDKDILSVSNYYEKGTVTERHILYGLVESLVKNYGRGVTLINFLKNDFGIEISPKVKKYILDNSNKNYKYDILGLLKSELLEKFYIDAKEECPNIKDVISFNKKIGGIIAYAYLGDVNDSVTGDKKSQKFEDDYLELLFEELKNLGFDAITYMPSRNTLEQLNRIRHLANRYNLFQISGEDINSPRQSFICKELERPEFFNLIESTWALIGHEYEANKSLDRGMFSDLIKNKYPNINERVEFFAKIGKEIGGVKD